MIRVIVSDASTLSEPQDSAEQQEESTSNTTSNKVANPVWEIFDQQVASSSLIFKTPVIDRKEDPLQWWKDHSQVYLTIANVAKVYLSTVATSVPSERLFSKSGELVSAKRNRIKPKNIDMILFLNKCC